MRDPARIDRIIDRLRAAWHASPDQRLGQLVMNAQRWLDHVDANRIAWATEDDVTEAGLLAMVMPIPEVPSDADCNRCNNTGTLPSGAFCTCTAGETAMAAALRRRS